MLSYKESRAAVSLLGVPAPPSEEAATTASARGRGCHAAPGKMAGGKVIERRSVVTVADTSKARENINREDKCGARGTRAARGRGAVGAALAANLTASATDAVRTERAGRGCRLSALLAGVRVPRVDMTSHRVPSCAGCAASPTLSTLTETG